MKNKIIIITVIAVLAAVIAFFYFRKSEIPFFKETSLYNAVPVSVPVFVELSSLKAIPLENPLFEKWADVEKIAGFRKWIQQLDSTIKENSDIRNSLRSERLIVALGLMGDKSFTPLVIQKIDGSGRKKSVDRLAREMFPEPEFSYKEIDYTGYKITSASTADNKKSINYCFTSGLLLASPNIVLVQQSLLQLDQPGITRDPSFEKLTKSFTAEPDIAFYVNQQLFPDFLLDYVNSSSITGTNEFEEEVKRNHYRNVRDFKRFASWSEFETEAEDNDIIMKGLMVASDTANQFLSVFEGQEPQRSGAGDILPKNTSFYTSYSFSNKKLFFDKLEKYFSLAGSFYKREDKIRKIESNFRIDFKKEFQSMVKSEIIVATTVIPSESAQKSTLFMFDVNSKSKTGKMLDSMLTNYALRKNQQLENFKTTFRADDKKEFTIIEFPFPSFPGIWLGKPFYSAQAKFAVFYKDYLVFSNSVNDLQNYLTGLESKERLGEDARFKRFQGNTTNKSNITAYVNVGRSLNLTTELLTAELTKKLEKKKNVLRKIQAVGWKVSSDKDIYSNEIDFIFDNGKQEDESGQTKGTAGTITDTGDSQIAWQCNTGSSIITKPVFTINHTDKEKREIMVQDKANKLYQISSEGKINWSFDVGEPIMSEIFQIDYLTNGKLQYLFSTKSKLYIIDRNGNNIEGFPVSFPAEATTGISVFDYDNNRVYRYFVPCSDRKIYAFDKQGKIMSGWNFEGTKSEVVAPVQFFRVGGKDYIVFKDKYQVYIRNRKGEPVAKTAAEFKNSRNRLFLVSSAKPKLITTDTKGTVYTIDFDGNYTEKKIGKFGDDHFFIADDLNSDKMPEYIFVDGKELTVTDENGTVLFTQKFENVIQNQPNIYRFGPKQKKLGITDTKGNQLYLFDSGGKLQSGFPLQGATGFSIGKTTQSAKKLNLIAGNKSGAVVCYMLD